MNTPLPTIGRIVIYRSKIDNGPDNDVLSPAIVIRTRATTVAAVIDRWGPESRIVLRELPDDDTVDLLVHGLGRDYREYGVRRGSGRGEWEWPQR